MHTPGSFFMIPVFILPAAPLQGTQAGRQRPTRHRHSTQAGFGKEGTPFFRRDMIGDQTGQCIEITDADKGIRTEFGRIHAEIGPVRLINDHPTDIRGLFIGIHYAGFIVNRTAGEERLVHMVRSDKFQARVP